MDRGRRWACCLCLAFPVVAQRYVVDYYGTGDFKDLPEAVAAVPDGSLLVVKRAQGQTYSTFTLRDKGLTIVASGGTCDLNGPPIQILGLSRGKRVLLSGFAGNADL